MASQEQLQQLADDDDTSSDGSSTSTSSSSSEAVARPVMRVPSSLHPKKRIKLSLGHMTNMPLPTVSGGAIKNDDDDDEEEEASKTNNDDNEEFEVAAALIASAAAPQVAKPSPPKPAATPVNPRSTSPLPMHNKERSSSPSPPGSSQTKRPSPLSMHSKARSSSPSPPGSSQAKRTNKRSLPTKKKKVSLDIDLDASEVKAMVVDSDDAGEDDAIAAVVDEPPVTVSATVVKTTSQTSSSSQTTTPTLKKRSTINRSVRLPPFSSPGLLIPANSSQTLKGKPAENGLTTIASVFDQYLNAVVDYSEESRTKRPYVGSCVKREVGDTFDSNVKLSRHFPRLVPTDLIPPKRKRKDDNEDEQMNGDHDDDRFNLAESLIKAFETNKTTKQSLNSDQASRETSASATPPDSDTAKKDKEQPKKRRKLENFAQLAPLSLTLPYPEWFIQETIIYAEKIREREKAIVAYQKEAEALEYENDDDDKDSHVGSKPKTVVPPIPKPPSPPLIEQLEGLEVDQFDASDAPIYLPKSKLLVDHLDKDCFHIVSGRYFGLISNSIADPHFVGPNAPGISGLNISSSNGLATAQSGGGATVGNSLQSTNSTSGKTNNATKSVETKIPTPNKVPKKKKKSGLVANTSATSLRKIVEDGGELAEKMKTCIVRAAVHASRSGRHLQAFRGPPNGEIYPDVSKAFAAYAGLKPCIRCKGNKQGAYHCRLLRKHKDLDYDGSDSADVLAPLFQVPMEELLWKP